MALTVRQKREWAKRLIAKQEAVELAQEALAEEIFLANEGGMSAYAIAAPLGSTGPTIHKIIEGVRDAR